MKKKVTVLILVNISLFIFCCYRCTYPLEFLHIRDSINQETALKIAQVLYKNKYGIFLEDKLFQVEYDKKHNEYHVALRNYREEYENVMYLGYRGIGINSENARITYYGLDHKELKESYYGREDELVK